MSALASHKEYWLDLLQRETKYFFEYETIFPIYENWERMSTAETVATDLLTTALDTFYCSAPRELTDKFLNWVIEVVDRALKDGKVHKTTAHSRFPRNRGEALRSRAFAKALLTGQIDIADAKQALEDLMVNVDQTEVDIANQQHRFEDVEEVKVLTAARLALILGDLDRFEELIPYRRKFTWHQTEYRLLLELGKTLKQGESPAEALIERFVEYFERVRAPTQVQVKQNRERGNPEVYVEKDLRRFEIGAIYAMYIDTAEPFTWQRAIELIAR